MPLLAPRTIRGAQIKALYINGGLRKLWRDRKVPIEYVVKDTQGNDLSMESII